jgi:hypothetical protein
MKRTALTFAARAAALDLQRRCNRAVKRRAVAYIYSDDWSCVNGEVRGMAVLLLIIE